MNPSLMVYKDHLMVYKDHPTVKMSLDDIKILRDACKSLPPPPRLPSTVRMAAVRPEEPPVSEGPGTVRPGSKHSLK